VLQQTVKLRTFNLLDVRHLSECGQDLCRANHQSVLVGFQILNANRACFTAAIGTTRVFLFSSSVTDSAPASPSTLTNRASNLPPCSGASTETHRPTNRLHSAGVLNGRSPGDDTSNT